VAGFPCVEVDTARWSHLKPIWAIDITNSSQFDGQAVWPVVWWFLAGWVLVQSIHYHLKTTQACQTGLRNKPQEKQTREPLVMIYTHGLLAHWCKNQVMVKSQPCHCMCGNQFFVKSSHIYYYYLLYQLGTGGRTQKAQPVWDAYPKP